MARRVSALLVDSGRRDVGEIADELAGLLACAPATWPERVAEVLDRKLTPAEAAAIQRLQRAPFGQPPAHSDRTSSLAPKQAGSL